jgi:hypothetical protein
MTEAWTQLIPSVRAIGDRHVASLLRGGARRGALQDAASREWLRFGARAAMPARAGIDQPPPTVYINCRRCASEREFLHDDQSP